MQRTKGSTSIAIGSILTILGSIFGILLGIFLLRAERFGAVLTNVAAEIRDMYPVASFLFSMGEAFGFIIMTISVFILLTGIMTFKRRRVLRYWKFTLVFGLILFIIGFLLMIYDFAPALIIPLIGPLLIIVGALLNKQQQKEMSEQTVN
ncbi:MAG TPA: hypothetical protein GXZ59_04195 [Clostridiaceae bacterium]|nr:hypothetical protein [Clostridiaceae bacterium]